MARFKRLSLEGSPSSMVVSRRRFLRLGGAALAAVSAFGARGSAEAQQAAIPLNVSWMPGFTSAYVLQSQRLLEGVGLKPNWIRFNAGPPHYAAIQGGSSDIGVIGVPPTIGALSQGIGMKIIAVEDDWSEGEGLVVRPESGIDKVADLKGRKVATFKGTNAHYALYAALQQGQIDASQVEITFLDPSVLVPAFKNKQIDAAWMYTPFLWFLEQAGGRIVVTNAELKIHALGVWVSRPEFLARNREATLRFMGALEKRVEAKRQHEGEVKKRIAETLSLSPEIVDKMYKVDKPIMLEDQVSANHPLSMVAGPGRGVRRYLQEIAAFMLKQQIIAKPADVNAAVEESILQDFFAARRKG